MNKLYYFTGNDGESGAFIGAETWRAARNLVIGHEYLDGYEFIEIRGRVCKKDGKAVLTELKGNHEADDVLATGYTNFWWTGECERCGKHKEHLDPIDGKFICQDCQEPDEVEK